MVPTEQKKFDFFACIQLCNIDNEISNLRIIIIKLNSCQKLDEIRYATGGGTMQIKLFMFMLISTSCIFSVLMEKKVQYSISDNISN